MEQTYGKEVAEVIAQRFLNDYLEYRENGVYIHEGHVENDPIGLFTWTAACELEGPDAPDALTAPALPIPFTARELGAFLLNGVGAHIVGCYGGSYESGPDEGMLKDLGIRAGKAREALRAAYAAILEAKNAVGALDEAKQSRADELKNKSADEYDIAFERENVMERVVIGKHKNGNPEFGDFIPNDEYLLRLARAKEAVSSLKLQALQAKTEADAERSAWLKGMVRQLLQTQSATPSASQATLGDVPAKHKAKKLSIETVALVYMREVYKAGHFESAVKFHKHLCKTTDEQASPFEMGTGINARRLFCPAAGSFYDVGTLAKIWAKIRVS